MKRVTATDMANYKRAYRAFAHGSMLLMAALETLEKKLGRKRALKLTKKLEDEL